MTSLKETGRMSLKQTGMMLLKQTGMTSPKRDRNDVTKKTGTVPRKMKPE